jgi:hypothetical protein
LPELARASALLHLPRRSPEGSAASAEASRLSVLESRDFRDRIAGNVRGAGVVRRTRYLAATAILALLAGGAGALASDDSCSAISQEVPGPSVLASAGPLDNLLGRSHSIRDESKRLLREAREASREASPPDDLCPGSCAAPSVPEIVFRSQPNKSLSSYAQAERCEQLLQDTSRSPVVYERQFATERDLNSWILGLARGQGADGADLYDRCDGRCSPQYTWLISPGPSGMQVDAEITCGHARDRDDNRYRISYSLRWTCEPRSASASTAVRVSAAP